MRESDIRQGDLVIYTDSSSFKEFSGEVAIVRNTEETESGKVITVEWMNDVKFQGKPAGLSKFSANCFDRMSVNIENWKK